MEHLLRDIRWAIRGLRKSPGFTAAAVAALALGIGANSAIFSVVNAVLMRPLPYREAERIVAVWNRLPAMTLPRLWLSEPELTDYRQRNRVFEEIAAFSNPQNVNLVGEGPPERVAISYVSANLLSLYGVSPHLGRTFRPGEDRPGESDLVVLRYGFWQRRFGGDPTLVGRTILLNGVATTVIGVMPAAFRHVDGVAMWAPLELDPAAPEGRGSHYLRAVARMKPGVTLERAQDDLTRMAAQLQQEYPENYPQGSGWSAFAVPLLDEIVAGNGPALLLLMGAVGLVLLIACANVGNLLLVRATARDGELAVRAALGATRADLLRGQAIEGGVLSLAGGGLGLLTAHYGLALLLATAPDSIPRADGIGLSLPVVVFTLATSLLAGVAFALLPALRITGSRAAASLRDGARGTRGADVSVRRSLVVAEVALALVLLAAAGLMVRSYGNLLDIDPGFEPASVLTLQLSLPSASYPEDDEVAGFYAELMSRIERLPGVESAGGISQLPLSGAESSGTTTPEGYEPPPGFGGVEADRRAVTPGYFRAMGIELLDGRTFNDFDRLRGEQVAVVDRAFAEGSWPDQEPVGKRLRRGEADSEDPWKTVVGVVEPVKHQGLSASSRMQTYFPHRQFPSRTLWLALRTRRGDPMALLEPVRETIWEMDPDLPISNASPMAARVAHALANQQVSTSLFALFGAVALALASLGVYGVASYSLSQRRREIGIRQALGADRAAILKLVVADGLTLVSYGAAIGLLAALAATRLMSSFLFDVGAGDPVTYAGVLTILLAVALLASVVPALRATRVDPVDALARE